MFKLKGSFSKKLFFTNVIIIVISLLSILFYFYYFLKETQHNQFENSLQTLNIKLAEQTDNIISNMDNIALQIASNPYILDQFSSLNTYTTDNYFESNHFERLHLRNLLNSYNFKNDLATRICLYDSLNNFVDAGSKPTDKIAINSFFKSDEFESISDAFKTNSNTSLFLPPRQDPSSLSPKYGDQMLVFSILRPIKNYQIVNPPIRGYVEIQLNYNTLSKIFNTLDPSIMCFIVDDSGNAIYSNKPTTDYMNSTIFNHDDYLITSSPLKQIDYHVILMQNKNILFANYKELKNMIVFIFIIIFFTTALSVLLLISHFTKPLNNLQKSIEKISIDNMSLSLTNQDNRDEFAQLNRAFNKMFEHLNISIQHEIVAKTNELKSNSLALQAQINPHFIHNVLSVMSVIAEENNVPKLENMCTKLSSMLRFSSSYHSTLCSLEEELLYAQSYLELMGERYENMFTFTITIPPQAKDIIVPKLILQPLAENSFNHGFKHKPIPWHISIDFHIENHYWFISIADNGCGFDNEFIESFQKDMNRMDLGNASEELMNLQIGGLCLPNIYLRLKILYENNATFKLENNSFGGATITLGGLINND